MCSKRLLFVNLLIGGLIVFLSQCANEKVSDRRGPEYASQQSCVNCHKDISDSYLETAHFHTSSPVMNRLQHFSDTSATFDFDATKVVVEKRGDKLYQVAYSNGREIQAHSFDLALGSGEKAQTYGYWIGNKLFQLPLTWYRVAGQWANSPGFPDRHADFQRAIVSRCLECHSSFAQSKIVKTGSLSVSEEIVKESIVLGVDCQRCHGPAAEHVSFHEKNPAEKEARYIAEIRNLSRQQKVDMCAVCHSGNDQKTIKPTFSFVPGDTLSNFYYPQYSRSAPSPDVHGNQSQMLASSACFTQSDMDCTSCHNTHRTEKNAPALFSQRCMTCHEADQHPKIAEATLKNNCIDCHMPMVPSKLISFQLAGKSTRSPYLLRSHKIAIYPEESKRILAYIESL